MYFSVLYLIIIIYLMLCENRDDESDSDVLDKETVGRLHFGGGLFPAVFSHDSYHFDSNFYYI